MKKKLILLPLLMLALGACGSSTVASSTPSTTSATTTSTVTTSTTTSETTSEAPVVDTNVYRIVGTVQETAWTADGDDFVFVKDAEENIFTVEGIDLFINDEWAITLNGDWPGQLGFSGATNLTIVDTETTHGEGGGFAVKNFKTLTDGNYDIELNTGVAPRVLTITRVGDPVNVPVVEEDPGEWHLVGTITGTTEETQWVVADTTFALVYDETSESYKGTFEFEANAEFKVISSDHSGWDYARGPANVETDDPAPAWLDLTGGNIKIVEAGNYLVEFVWVASEGATINGAIFITLIPDVEYFGTELFFSEYIEGPANNKVLEIYNPTAETVDLSVYTVKTFSNGRPIDSLDPATYNLTGTLPSKQTFLFHLALEDDPESTSDSFLTDVSIKAAVAAVPEAQRWVGAYVSGASTQIASFNGDDSFGLFKNGVLIDVFGTIGLAGTANAANDPGAAWTVNFANGEADTMDVVLTRIPTIGAPSVNALTYTIGTTPVNFINAFNPLEWSFSAYETVDAGTHTVGTHVMTGPVA